MDDGRRVGSQTLASVNLPPLPVRPGSAVRLRPPTPPPRPDSTFTASPPPPAASPASRTDGGLLFSSLSNGVRANLAASPQPPSSPQPHITLTNPRTVRSQNVYVDTPIKGVVAAAAASPASPLAAAAVVKRPRTLITKQSSHPHPASSTVINHQPQGTCKKIFADPAPPLPIAATSPTDSIICGECGRCRCAACRSARALPSTWLCHNACLCSAETVLDVVSCMCCVKAGMYHCAEGLVKDPDTRDETWIDKPCSCSGNKWWLRWSCLAMLSVPLPCLFCYPLLKGGIKLAERCYQAATTQGCQCAEEGGGGTGNAASPGVDSQKRLLS